MTFGRARSLRLFKNIPEAANRNLGSHHRSIIMIFYADQQQCDEWNSQLLADLPTLADKTESWRIEPGFWWRTEDDEGGPFATWEECERDLREALAARERATRFVIGLWDEFHGRGGRA